jgi:hypothetical protein
MTSEKSYMPLESEDDELDFATTSKPDTRWRTRFWVLAVFSGLLLLCSWLVILLQANSSTSYRHQYGNKVEVPYCKFPMRSDTNNVMAHRLLAPARPYLQYANRYMTQDPDTPKFMGKPRPELDQAWHDLLEGKCDTKPEKEYDVDSIKGTLIKFSGTELQRAGNASSVAHKEAGFVGGLGISHSLHCLVRKTPLRSGHQLTLSKEAHQAVHVPRVLLLARRTELGRT